MSIRRPSHAKALLAILAGLIATPAAAQVPPSATEIAGYAGLHAAVAAGDQAAISRLLSGGADPNTRDGHGRTPLHVAAFKKDHAALRALAKAGADVNALENDRYDIITIAAVADDVPTLKLALELGGNPKAITSRYDGTALIAAAHLGHDGVVRELIAAGAPLDHVNNLGWTALMESVVLGDGGPRHVASAKALVGAGAKPIPDRSAVTPLQHAERRGYKAMVEVLR